MDWTFYCLVYLLTVYFKADLVSCLECWVCIGENCDMSPSENHRVKVKTCKEGQSCQKVEYIGRDYITNKEYHSVTRSCSQDQCRNRRDNCTETLITNPGCTDRLCCDEHLCNAALINSTNFTIMIMLPLMVWMLLPHGLYT